MIIRVRLHLRARGADFVHPMDPAPRTAILSPGFRDSKQVRVFPQGWDARAARFEPASIAAPAEVLLDLAKLDLHFEHSLIAFTYEGQAGLSYADRDSLWRAFGVPIFEQRLGKHSELLATECEAHAGLHVVNGYTGARLETEVCACGNHAPRLPRGPRVEELVELLA
jgi:hypothetical protein